MSESMRDFEGESMREENYINELLALVAKLTDRYTSKESSSVSYETAQMLTEAVVYTLEHVAPDASSRALSPVDPVGELSLAERYELGYQNILSKAIRTKQQYEQLLPQLETYGCRHYHDTLYSGMREFFRRYDARFQPQNALLLLDYPLIAEERSLRGIDLIADYLYKISLENELLSCYPKAAVVDLLRRTCPDYEQGYMGNVCELVLHTSLYCVAARRPITELFLSRYEEEKVRQGFLQMTQEMRKAFVAEYIKSLGESFGNPAVMEYMMSAADRLAVDLTRRFAIEEL